MNYVPDRAFTISISGEINFSVLQNAGARSIITLTPEQKMHPSMARGIYPTWAVRTPGVVDVWVSFPRTISMIEMSSLLRENKIEITRQIIT